MRQKVRGHEDRPLLTIDPETTDYPLHSGFSERLEQTFPRASLRITGAGLPETIPLLRRRYRHARAALRHRGSTWSKSTL